MKTCKFCVNKPKPATKIVLGKPCCDKCAQEIAYDFSTAFNGGVNCENKI